MYIAGKKVDIDFIGHRYLVDAEAGDREHFIRLVTEDGTAIVLEQKELEFMAKQAKQQPLKARSLDRLIK